jgi:type III pantothenate kinase
MSSALSEKSHWLLIDVGNTHTVAGLHRAPGRAVAAGASPSLTATQVRFRTDAMATSDEYRSQLRQLFHSVLSEPLPEPERVVVSSVVPALNPAIRAAFEPRGVPVLLVQPDSPRDFDLELPHPEQLGADRLANVAGALATPGVQAPFLIIDAGTATTFCLVAARERPTYIGGAIVPGLETGWRALVARAAKLSSVPLDRPEDSVGTTTETQIQSGVLHGYEALIEGLADRLVRDAERRSPGFMKHAKLIATGGCVNLLKLSDRFEVDPDLTLRGLLRYGELLGAGARAGASHQSGGRA